MTKLAAIACCLLVAGCSPGEEGEPMASASATTTAAPTAVAVSTREEDIDRFLLHEYPEAGTISYALAWNDLNGDGAQEAIVYPVGPYFCGTGGCNLLVLTQAGPMWSKVGDTSVARTPVTVLESASHGWKDLAVPVSGGGAPTGRVVLSFDGKSYTENASMAPAAPADAAGTEVLLEESTMREAVAVQEAGPG
ncbi:hypothetical protein [Aurantiacibacter luteus]|uniref:Lipoprotein n=1 Tax=Aurantiacibacter luteus TaxID=1581420 RepID=A0A0G9MWH5_9SPHN|nr:hypothetical protein [Aurantiacibacter luteus]KLE35070.1 hypothetical protein AAW00_00815 [Aurantiacibacter luteus]